MSSRPAGRTAFENLRPTILRQPTRTIVTPEAEARLLDSTSTVASDVPPTQVISSPAVAVSTHQLAEHPAPGLLQKKKKDFLVPVTFRMPQSLKERLERTARLHEVNQTDLINEAIDLNLQRYS